MPKAYIAQIVGLLADIHSQIHTNRLAVGARAAAAIPQRRIIIRQARADGVLRGKLPRLRHQIAESR